MNALEFLEAVKEEFDIQDRELSLEDNFRDYPEWTSLTFLTLVGFIDTEFDIILSPTDLADCFTLGDLWEFVNK